MFTAHIHTTNEAAIERVIDSMKWSGYECTNELHGNMTVWLTFREPSDRQATADAPTTQLEVSNER